MSFVERRATQQQYREQRTISPIQEAYLRRTVVDRLDQLTIPYVDHLNSDLAKGSRVLLPSTWCSGEFYKSAQEEALTCLTFSLYSKDIFGSTIRLWTPIALKVYDALLLYFIQELCRETIIPTGPTGRETDVYRHLKMKGGHLRALGESLFEVYQIRNSFTHVQQLLKDGKRIIVTPTNKDYERKKVAILSHLNKGIIAFSQYLETTNHLSRQKNRSE